MRRGLGQLSQYGPLLTTFDRKTVLYKEEEFMPLVVTRWRKSSNQAESQKMSLGSHSGLLWVLHIAVSTEVTQGTQHTVAVSPLSNYCSLLCLRSKGKSPEATRKHTPTCSIYNRGPKLYTRMPVLGKKTRNRTLLRKALKGHFWYESFINYFSGKKSVHSHQGS